MTTQFIRRRAAPAMTAYDGDSAILRDCGQKVPEGCQSGEAFINWFGWAVAQAHNVPAVAHMLDARELLHMTNQVEVALSSNGHRLQCSETVDKPSGTGFLFRGVLAESAFRGVSSHLYRAGHSARIEVRDGMTAVIVEKR